jgi:hypothetical protein
MKKWLETGSLPDDKKLRADLVGPKKKPTSEGIIQLESKKDMKLRKIASPDRGDALAVTFAFQVGGRQGRMAEATKRVANGDILSGSHSPAAGPQNWMGS